MDRVIVIFDDTIDKCEIIRDVIGSKGFSKVVVKRKKLELFYQETVRKIYPNVEWKSIHSIYEFYELSHQLKSITYDSARVIHCFANYIVTDEESVLLTLKKLEYIDEDYRLLSGTQNAGMMFPEIDSYCKFIVQVCKDGSSVEAAKFIKDFITIEGLMDIGVVPNFIQCITGNFDSRFFNSLSGNEYRIVKSSTNKKKIKSEYTFYHLLPEDMQYWYVMPFSYQEDEKTASYTMERLHMTDLAIKWVHGSVDESEFKELMDKYFYFIKSRHERTIARDEYKRISDELYVNKVVSRIEDLKKLSEFSNIKKMIEAGCGGKNIDEIVQWYLELKKKVESRTEYPCISVIGHGDPCFGNALYNKSTKTLKFIDPKGALSEEELWTNPYYDVAKLSHSVCGGYDFFNSALFEIKVNQDFEYELNLDYDEPGYIDIFKEVLQKNGFDYLTVRIYEASLFLSMLPLHIDYPHKVFGFVLNVIRILKYVETEKNKDV